MRIVTQFPAKTRCNERGALKPPKAPLSSVYIPAQINLYTTPAVVIITHRLRLDLAKVADIIRVDGEIVGHIMLLTELDNDGQADARSGIYEATARRLLLLLLMWMLVNVLQQRCLMRGRREDVGLVQVLNRWVSIEVSR